MLLRITNKTDMPLQFGGKVISARATDTIDKSKVNPEFLCKMAHNNRIMITEVPDVSARQVSHISKSRRSRTPTILTESNIKNEDNTNISTSEDSTAEESE